MSVGQFGLCCCAGGNKQIEVPGYLPNIGQLRYGIVAGVPQTTPHAGYNFNTRFRKITQTRRITHGGEYQGSASVEFNIFSREYEVSDPDREQWRAALASAGEAAKEAAESGSARSAELAWVETYQRDGGFRQFGFRVPAPAPGVPEGPTVFYAEEAIAATVELNWDSLTSALATVVDGRDWSTVPDGARAVLVWHRPTRALVPVYGLLNGDGQSFMISSHLRAGAPPLTVVRDWRDVGDYFLGFHGIPEAPGVAAPGITGAVVITRSRMSFGGPLCIWDRQQVPNWGDELWPPPFFRWPSYANGYSWGLGLGDTNHVGPIWPVISSLAPGSHYVVAGGTDYELREPGFWGERTAFIQGHPSSPCPPAS